MKLNFEVSKHVPVPYQYGILCQSVKNIYIINLYFVCLVCLICQSIQQMLFCKVSERGVAGPQHQRPQARGRQGRRTRRRGAILQSGSCSTPSTVYVTSFQAVQRPPGLWILILVFADPDPADFLIADPDPAAYKEFDLVGIRLLKSKTKNL